MMNVVLLEWWLSLFPTSPNLSSSKKEDKNNFISLVSVKVQLGVVKIKPSKLDKRAIS